MSIIRRNLNQVKDSLKQASNIAGMIDQDNPNLLELKNAATQATKAAEILNRLVGMQTVIQSTK